MYRYWRAGGGASIANQNPKRPRTIKKGKAMKLISPELSRRALMAGLGAAALPAQAQPRNGTRPRALALIGDRYHNPDYIHVSLDRVFHDLNIPIDYTMDYAGLSAASIKPYQLLLILRDGMIWPGGYSGPDSYNAYEMNLENESDFPAAKSVMWMTEEQGLAIKNFVQAGGGGGPRRGAGRGARAAGGGRGARRGA